MNYIVKLTFFGYIIAKLAATASVEYMEVVVLLLAAASSLYREKFGSYLVLFVLEGAIVYYGCTLNTDFSFLFGLLVYDLIGCRYQAGVIPVVLSGIYLLGFRESIDFILIMSLCCIFAYMKGNLQNKEELYRSSFDKQREYSYQLEQTKVRLLAAAEEAAHLAEIKERNRIARQIHDNVGHSIAGALMQLQAAHKVLPRDSEKASELLGNSIGTLSNTLTAMRETVHNIKPSERLGVEYLKGIVDGFSYCPVDFKVSGNFGELPVSIMQILHYNIKEALTNVSKYSRADRVDIKIDNNDRFVRLYIKDNGIGSGSFKEGLGLSGMKERLRNVGGSISISTEDGFLIVCIIPIKKPAEVIV